MQEADSAGPQASGRRQFSGLALAVITVGDATQGPVEPVSGLPDLSTDVVATSGVGSAERIYRGRMQISCDAILFDNDGVLVDSHDQVDQAWRALAEEVDLDIDSIWSELVGARARDTLRRHLAPEVLDHAVDRLEDLEVELAVHTRPLTGSVDLLAGLGNGPWTIVTSATRRLAEARWRGAGIVPPSRTVTAEDVDRGKPHPDPFVAGARSLGVESNRCVVFEDSPSGGAAGRAAGATVIAVGAQKWEFEPALRIGNLSDVRVETDGDGWIVHAR